VADEIFTRLMRLFQRDERRPPPGQRRRSAVYRRSELEGPDLFYECFDGDNGRGIGSSHQTGWTALIARIMAARGKRVERDAAAAGRPRGRRASNPLSRYAGRG
jgi:hypothetical protein